RRTRRRPCCDRSRQDRPGRPRAGRPPPGVVARTVRDAGGSYRPLRKTFDVDGAGRDRLVRGQADVALDPGGGQVLAQERLQLGGGVGQRGTDGARGQTEQVQHGLDGDDLLSAEDAGVHRGQPAVYGQRLGDLARVEGVDHLLEVAADDVTDNTHK